MKVLNVQQVDAHYGAITVDTDQATVTLDMSITDKHQVTITASRIIAVSNDNDGQTFMLIIIQGGAGSFGVTWFSGIKWAGGGTPPTLTTTAGKADVFSFLRTGSGAYYGFVVGQNL